MEYVAFTLWCFAVAVGGGLVGLVLGNLRLPAVLLLAGSPAAGAGANIGISAVAAGAASIAHVREGRVNWRLFTWMAPPSVVGAVAGGYLSGELPANALRLAIAAVLLVSGVDLLRPAAGRPVAARRSGDSGRSLRAAALLGLVIGLVGGVVGLIMGSLRMPALLRLGEAPASAVGTNVTVGLCVGLGGVVGHLPSAAPDWGLLALGAAASIPGALLGSRLTGRLSEPALIRAIGVVLLVAAASVAAQALT